MSQVKIRQGKDLVEFLFKDIGQTPGDASRIARAIKKIAGDLYTEAERFIFELIQNADDLPNETGKVEMKFFFLQEHIAIVHNGQPFTIKHVEAISDIGDSTKKSDSSKTGYKGIGFKSVFTDSDCVYIYSGNYRFRYDKSFHNNPDETPWEIKPIWTEKKEFPQEIQNLDNFFNYPVSMALRVGSKKNQEYKTRVKQFFSEPRFMLFLRHVSLIDVIGLGEDIRIRLDKQNNFHQIYYNDSLISNWLIKNIEFDILPEVQEQIKDDQKVPNKLKEATKTKISFAAKIEDQKLVSLSPNESVLFTYLPTNVKEYNFPFLVNADFLTTANRQDLHRDSDWNTFIFERIAYHLLEFLQSICIDEKQYQNNITALIPTKFPTSSKLKQAFNQGLEKGLKDIAFIVSDETKQLLKVSEAIIDETGITKIIEPNLIKSVLNISKNFVSKTLVNVKVLEQLWVETLNFSQLCQFFNSSTFQDYITPEKNIKILMHLKDKIHLLVEEQVPIILDENSKLRFSKVDTPVYSQPSQEDKVLLTFDTFYFIHPQLDNYSKTQPVFGDLLKKLQVSNFDAVEIIKTRISTKKYTSQDTEIEAPFINYVRFIFKYRSQLTSEHLNKLSELSLLYRQNNQYYVQPASKCYLSNYYRPKYSLENIAKFINLEAFIINDYCELEQDIDDWREFFISIGIIKPEGLDIIRKNIIPLIDNKQITENNTIPVTQFIFSVFRSDSIPDTQITTKLNSLPLISSNGLKPAKECILSKFYNVSNQSSDFLKEIPIPNLVSQDYCDKNQNPQEWREFFLKIGVKELKGIDIIRYKISLLKDNPDLVSQDNAVEITREIFSHRNELSQDDFNNLYNLKLLLKNGQLASANECYLSNQYNPQQDLESLFAETDFNKIVSHQYIDNNNGEYWKEFFKRIGVAEEIRIWRETQRQTVNFEYRTSYLDFINVSYNLKSDFRFNFEYQNLLLIKSLLLGFNKYNYCQNFWKYIIKNWDKFNLDQKATIWIANQPRTVPTLFEFDVTQNPSIPCTDGKCRKPSEVYSYSLQSYLKNYDLPVSSVDFPENIESFLGLRHSLDFKDCLMLLEQIDSSCDFSKDTKQLYFIYRQLNKLIENNAHQQVSIDLESIKLLACDDSFHPVSELYYIDPELNLPSKRNRNLVKFPEIDRTSFNFEKILSIFGIKKISLDDIQINYNSENHCLVLPKLIKERASCISVYLTSSSYDKQDWINKIIQRLENLKIYRVGKLSYSYSNIDYEEPIYNFYDEQSNTIYYVGEWNSRRNSKLGNYLIKALGLNSREITGERLLDFLENSMEEIVLYLQDSGCDVTGLLPDNQIENESEKTFSFLGDNSCSDTLPTYDQGTGNNAEYWGKFGEDKAIQFYQKIGYQVKNVSNQPQKGYDLECIKDGQEIFVEVKTISSSEVKTISSSNETIRITINEWRCMCHAENQQKYELLIVVHQGEFIEKYIQVKSAWVTLQEIFSKLDQQELTSRTYNSGYVENLIGFQRNSKNQLNEVLINWKRLFDQGFHGSEKIQYYLDQ